MIRLIYLWKDSVSTVYVFKWQKVKVSVCSQSLLSICFSVLKDQMFPPHVGSLQFQVVTPGFILTVCFLCFRGSRMCSTESSLQTLNRFRCTTPAPGRLLKVGSPEDHLSYQRVSELCLNSYTLKYMLLISCVYPSCFCLFVLFVHHVCLFIVWPSWLLFMLLMKVLSHSGDGYFILYIFSLFIVFYCSSFLFIILYLYSTCCLLFIHHVHVCVYSSCLLFILIIHHVFMCIV